MEIIIIESHSQVSPEAQIHTVLINRPITSAVTFIRKSYMELSVLTTNYNFR